MADDIHTILAAFEARLWAGLDARFNRLEQSIRGHDLPADKLLDLRREGASMWENYALAQQRMDRLEARVEELERKLEPPLPPFPEFKP